MNTELCSLRGRLSTSATLPRLHIKQSSQLQLVSAGEVYHLQDAAFAKRDDKLHHIVLHAVTLLLGRGNSLCTTVSPARS